MLQAMGFPTIATIAATAVTTAAAVAPKIYEAKAAAKQAQALDQAADTQQKLADQQAAVVENTAMENQRRGNRNALAELASARVDAAASNTAQEGSTYVRGVDLATRLQDEINSAANEQLARADQIRRQGAYDAQDTRNQATQSRATRKAATVSGVGALFSGIARGLKDEAS